MVRLCDELGAGHILNSLAFNCPGYMAVSFVSTFFSLSFLNHNTLFEIYFKKRDTSYGPATLYVKCANRKHTNKQTKKKKTQIFSKLCNRLGKYEEESIDRISH